MISIIDSTLTCLPDVTDIEQIYKFTCLLAKLPVEKIIMSRLMYNNIMKKKKFSEQYKLDIASNYQADIVESLPYAGIDMVRYLKKMVLKDKHMLFEPLNDFCGATAAVVEWSYVGGRQAVTAFAGTGNHACTEEVLMSLCINGSKNRKENWPFLQEMASIYECMTRKPISTVKPILGKDIFMVESGIHVDGLMKDAQLYELYPPEMVGLQRRIFVGKFSGKRSILLKLGNLGMDKSMATIILPKVQQHSIQLGRSLDDKELELLIKRLQYEEKMQHC